MGGLVVLLRSRRELTRLLFRPNQVGDDPAELDTSRASVVARSTPPGQPGQPASQTDFAKSHEPKFISFLMVPPEPSEHRADKTTKKQRIGRRSNLTLRAQSLGSA